MNIVYMIELLREENPRFYIGSKSNCSIVDGKILDKRGKIYIGSAKDKSLKESIENGCIFKLHVLGVFKKYEQALIYERLVHIQNDVAASIRFFNRNIANENNFSNPDYATYKHSITGKIARLKRNHPDVLSKMWVGITSGQNQSDETKRKKARYGPDNHFYGKKHTEQSKNKAAKKIGDALRGKPKTKSHRDKLSEAAKRRWKNERKKRDADREETCI